MLSTHRLPFSAHNVRRRSYLFLTYALLFFSLGTVAGCGKSPQIAASAVPPKLAAFEETRALYLAVDVHTSARTLAYQIAEQKRAQDAQHARSRTASRIVAGPQTRPEAASDEHQETSFDSLCAPFQDLSDTALLEAIYDVSSEHYVLGYRRARDHMYGLASPVVDIFDGEIEDIYTGRRVKPDGSRTPGNTNTEHSWPRSKGTREGPAMSDLHHLFVVDQSSNYRRQNFEFGIPRCGGPKEPQCRWVSENHGADAQPSRIGLNAQGDPVFEVRTSRKGDIARAQFYISARYHLPIEAATEKVLRQWHKEDPPDARERERNQRIERVQNNRNPFVDCPDLVDAIERFDASHAP